MGKNASFSDEELKAVEAMFGSLEPRPMRLDRDRLMFLAGQASRSPRRDARTNGLAWRGGTAGALFIAGGLAAMLCVAVWPGSLGTRGQSSVPLIAGASPSVGPGSSTAASFVQQTGRGNDIIDTHPHATIQWPAVAAVPATFTIAGTTNYVGLRDRVLLLGPDMLPTALLSAAGDEPSGIEETEQLSRIGLLRQWLDQPGLGL